MDIHVENAIVADHSKINRVYFLLTLTAPNCSIMAKPGQFVHVRIPRLDGAVLRRPFSIFDVVGDQIKIIYKPVGKGTDAMTRLIKGDSLSIMGPLGNGFPDPAEGRLPVIVAGGYGAAPLFFFASRSLKKGIAFLGGATSQDIILPDRFKKLGWKIKIATENGSMGTRGLVTLIFDEWLSKNGKKNEFECYVCGPDGLLKAMALRALKHGWKAWLSLDKHMGCGVGACLGCVQRIKLANDTEGWARVCKDGPVFEASQIIW